MEIRSERDEERDKSLGTPAAKTAQNKAQQSLAMNRFGSANDGRATGPQGVFVEQMMTAMTASAALLVSLGLAVLAEELVFDGLFRCFFATRTAALQGEMKARKGEL